MIQEMVRLSRVSGRPLGLQPGFLRDTSHVDTLTRALTRAWEHAPARTERLL
jgi:hypothetical protein